MSFQNTSIQKSNQGYTLIELMVSIVLGLLVSAAAVQLFATGQTSLMMQRGMADLQDSGNFGLNYLTSDLRKANLGANRVLMNDQTLNGGIVFTSPETVTTVTIPTNVPRTIAATEAVPLTNTGAAGSSNVQIAAADALSDQLVIQFLANTAGKDCEGHAYAENRYVIQRYFLRTDSQVSTSEPNSALALACEGGSYAVGATTILKNPSTSTTVFGTSSGQIIIPRVDYFHALLAISNDDATANFRYITIQQYLAMATPRPRINAIQIGMLVRAAEGVGKNSLLSDAQTFDVLNSTVTLKTPAAGSPKFLRQVITQTIAIRNAIKMESGA